MEGCEALTAPQQWETHGWWYGHVTGGCPGGGAAVGLCEHSASLGSLQHPNDGSSSSKVVPVSH